LPLSLRHVSFFSFFLFSIAVLTSQSLFRNCFITTACYKNCFNYASYFFCLLVFHVSMSCWVLFAFSTSVKFLPVLCYESLDS